MPEPPVTPPDPSPPDRRTPFEWSLAAGGRSVEADINLYSALLNQSHSQDSGSCRFENYAPARKNRLRTELEKHESLSALVGLSPVLIAALLNNKGPQDLGGRSDFYFGPDVYLGAAYNVVAVSQDRDPVDSDLVRANSRAENSRRNAK